MPRPHVAAVVAFVAVVAAISWAGPTAVAEHAPSLALFEQCDADSDGFLRDQDEHSCVIKGLTKGETTNEPEVHDLRNAEDFQSKSGKVSLNKMRQGLVAESDADESGHVSSSEFMAWLAGGDSILSRAVRRVKAMGEHAKADLKAAGHAAAEVAHDAKETVKVAATEAKHAGQATVASARHVAADAVEELATHSQLLRNAVDGDPVAIAIVTPVLLLMLLLVRKAGQACVRAVAGGLKEHDD